MIDDYLQPLLGLDRVDLHTSSPCVKCLLADLTLLLRSDASRAFWDMLRVGWLTLLHICVCVCPSA